MWSSSFRMALRVHGLQKAPLSTMVGPSFHGFVLKSKHKHDMQVTWEPDACEKKVLSQITGTAPLVELSMRHIWTLTREESPMINPSGEPVALWITCLTFGTSMAWTASGRWLIAIGGH